MIIPKLQHTLYLRFGDIPPNEESGIYKGDMGRIGSEIGISCYRGVVIEDKVYIIMPHIPSTTYYWLIDEYNRGKTPLYIISGDEVGVGTDGEPLLKNVSIEKIVYNWKI